MEQGVVDPGLVEEDNRLWILARVGCWLAARNLGFFDVEWISDC